MSGLRLLVVGVDAPLPPFLSRLIRGLRRRGVHVTVASGRPVDDADTWLPVPQSTGLPFRAGAGLVAAAPLGGLRRIGALARSGRARSGLHDEILRTTAADVVYVPWIAHAVDRPSLFELGAPTVVSCRGSQINVAPLNPRRQALAAGLPEVFARAAAVHCVSDAMCTEAARHGLDRAKATVIRPAVDLDRFPPASTRTEPGPLRVLIVGTITWRKGVEYAAIGLGRAVEADVDLRLDIVGSEADGGAARHAVHDLGLRPITTFHGALEPGEVARRLRQADAVLVPSVTEGIANVALEAMATRRPVVVTDVGGMGEAVTDGVEGRVVPPRDPDAIAAAIAELTDPVRRDELGRAGRRRVERDHRLTDQVAAFASLLDAASERD